MRFALRTLYIFAITVSVVSFFSCHESAEIKEPVAPVVEEPEKPVWTFNSDQTELGTTDFYTFDIKRDYSKLKERIHTDSLNKLYAENTRFEDTISIAYNGGKAIVNCDNPTAVKVATNGAHVTVSATRELACILTGNTTDGSLAVNAAGKVRINLNGANIKNASGPAISNMSEKLCFLITDSISMLSDGATYAEVNDSLHPKGCIYSKGKLAISGQAPLKIVADGADAIHSSKDIFIRRGSNIDIESHSGSAIKAKDNVQIEGGVININSTGLGGHGITATQEVAISGGRTTIISNTGGRNADKNSRGIKSDSLVTITGGIVRVRESSLGGKGIRAGHRFYAKNCIVDVLTFGADDSHNDSKNRGISGIDEIRMDSARVRVRSIGGRTEALSSRHKLLVNNSLVEVKAVDDAISIGDTIAADIEINNGRVFADAGADAFDSNMTMHINSGIAFGIARVSVERGFDCDFNEFKIGPEATLVGLSLLTSPPSVKLLEHPMCFVPCPLRNPVFCVTTTDKNDNLISFVPSSYNLNGSMTRVFLSLPEFKKDESYDFCSQATVKPKHTFHGLSIGGTAQDKNVASKRTLSRNYNKF